MKAQPFCGTIFLSMQIRRNTLISAMGDKAAQKAVSVCLLMKDRLGPSSVLHRPTLSRIAETAGISPSTAKRYLPLWLKLGLVEYQGTKNRVLVVKKMASSNKHRNIEVGKLNFNSFKELYKAFRSLLFLLLNSRKSFLKRVIRIATNPKRGEDFKKARKLRDHYAKGDYGKTEYTEYGLSYKTIAKKLGYCARTAQNIVELAVKNKWCKKVNHSTSQLLPGVCGMYVEGYTFTTHNFGWKILANTYEESAYWYGILIGGKK